MIALPSKFLVTLFCIVNFGLNSVVAKYAGCPQALKWTPQLRDQIEGSVYWTKLFVKKQPTNVVPPIGFVRGKDLVNSKLLLGQDILFSMSYVSTFNVNPFSIDYFQTSYEADEEYAAFKSGELIYSYTFMKKFDGSVTQSETNAIHQNPIKFALVYVSADYGFRIFQTCNGEVAWVQVNYLPLQEDLENDRQILDRPGWMEKIIEVLTAHGMNSEHIENTTFDRFPFEVPYPFIGTK